MICFWLEAKLHPKVTQAGDRIIEWSYVAGRIPDGPGDALDFGPGKSWLSMIAVNRGYRVTEVDLRDHAKLYVEPDIERKIGDISGTALPAGRYDLVINCSSIEHVGLAGRYGEKTDRREGDLDAMSQLRSLLKPGGKMLLTLPVGTDSVFRPLHRVYGEERLPRLLEGWDIDHEEYWRKSEDNRWERAPRHEVIAAVPRWDLYGLGCFTLRRAD